jgi:hypothetical protein
VVVGEPVRIFSKWVKKARSSAQTPSWKISSYMQVLSTSLVNLHLAPTRKLRILDDFRVWHGATETLLNEAKRLNFRDVREALSTGCNHGTGNRKRSRHGRVSSSPLLPFSSRFSHRRLVVAGA